MASQLLLDGEDNLITIVLHYKVKKNKYGNRQFSIIEEEKAEKMIAEFEKKKEAAAEGEEVHSDLESIATKWKPQTWQTNNSLLKQSMTYNKVSGTSELDWSAYQQNVFAFCLDSWDVTDGSGNPVPPTIENVGMLPSNIARALIENYDEALSVDDDEKKE